MNEVKFATLPELTEQLNKRANRILAVGVAAIIGSGVLYIAQVLIQPPSQTLLAVLALVVGAVGITAAFIGERLWRLVQKETDVDKRQF